MNRRQMMMTVLAGSPPYYQLVKNILGSSLLSYHPCWDQSGTAAADISGNGYTGSYPGTISLGAVGIGDGRTSVNLVASTARLSQQVAGLLAAITPNLMFWSAWFSITDAATWTDGTTRELLGVIGTGNNQVYLRTITGGILSVGHWGNGTLVNRSAGHLAGTRWMHLAIAADVANDRLSLYINGVLHEQRTALTMVDFAGATANIYTGNTWRGRLAHVVVANAIPTDAQIRQLANFGPGQIVFVGDSRTQTSQWCYPAAELATPDGLRSYGGYGVANYGYAGATWAIIAGEAATIDALLTSGNNVLVVWAGVNTGAENAAQIYARMSAYCTARRAAGWRVLLCTEIDAQADMGWHNTVWPALNALIAADHSFADGLIDLGADARLQDATDVTYYNADKLHLVAAGQAVVRDVVYPVLAQYV